MANWDPSNLANLALWLDADDASTITESSGSVSAWADKSTNGNDASQATSALQPAYVTLPSGQGAVRFNSDYLVTTSPVYVGDVGRGVFIVGSCVYLSHKTHPNSKVLSLL